MKQEEDLESTLLPKYSAVVIDEAHTLEDNAAEYLGLRINSAATFNFLNRLFNPESGRGLLLKSGTEALALRTMISEIKDQAGMFFRMYEEFLLEQDDSIRRVRQAGIAPDVLSSPMNKLGHELREYIKLLDNDDLKTELEAQPGRCDGIADSICHFVNMNCPEHVYWVEEERNSITLNAAPLNVNLMLNALLFTKQFPVILTSATLTVRHRLDYFRNRVGFSHGAELVLDSPFKPDQVRLYLPKNMPEPNHADYHDALTEHIKKMVSLTQGKAFVLFTSYRTLRYCADELEDFFDRNDINLLIQGESLNRTTLLREFKEDITSVLFGTDSFWTGVDVPGESLSNVIITKLPFAVPTHPLIQARSEQIEESGKSSFMEYSLPEAVLKFRQGIGRLIRSRSDRGIIAILDRRAVSKRYGQFFLDSIPNYPVRYID
jgi:ATP-dependent DNA helicase DinG